MSQTRMVLKTESIREIQVNLHSNKVKIVPRGHGVEARVDTPFYAIFGICATTKRNVGGISFFFLSYELVGGTVAQRVVFGLLVLVLLTNSCAGGSIYSGTSWHN